MRQLRSCYTDAPLDNAIDFDERVNPLECEDSRSFRRQCWGMILGWIRRDGMARMRMIGVILTPLSMYFKGFVFVTVYSVQVRELASCFWNN